MAKNMQEIAENLQQLKFKRKKFGGVDETDVWLKISQLQSEYSELLEVVTGQYETSLSEWRGYAAALERQLGERDDESQRPP